jgi:hypothetical protein
MGSYSTIGMAEHYQDLLRNVHLNFWSVSDRVHLSNERVSTLPVLRQSTPYIGLLSQSTIFISSQDFHRLLRAGTTAHRQPPWLIRFVLWSYFMRSDNDRVRYPCIEIEKYYTAQNTRIVTMQGCLTKCDYAFAGCQIVKR